MCLTQTKLQMCGIILLMLLIVIVVRLVNFHSFGNFNYSKDVTSISVSICALILAYAQNFMKSIFLKKGVLLQLMFTCSLALNQSSISGSEDHFKLG